jgi:hypothetical protein
MSGPRAQVRTTQHIAKNRFPPVQGEDGRRGSLFRPIRELWVIMEGWDVRQRLRVLCSAAAESFAAAKIWGVWLMRILVVLLRGEYALKE